MMHLVQLSIYLFFTGILIFVAAWLILIRTHEDKTRKSLNTPPGSLGLPVVGETIYFTKHHPFGSLGEFMEKRIKRYGKIYKTHLMGNPTIISVDLEFNRFVFQNDGRLFEHNLPRAYQKLFGRTIMEMITGDTHRSLKGIYHYFLGIPRLQTHFLHNFEVYTLQALSSWKEDVPVSAHEETKKVTFNMILKSILGMNPGEEEMEELRRLYHILEKGFTSLPVDLPGTNFRKALKARKEIHETIEQLKEQRIKKKDSTSKIDESDYLGILLERSNLKHEQLLDHMLGILFVGYESSSTSITLAIYFLARCPKAIKQLQEEHMIIARKKKERGEFQITWEDYKLMEFTQCVINETLRLGNVSRVLHRKAVVDIKYKGYNIPKGWSVVPVYAATHLDGDVFEEPKDFDPWRWQNMATKKMQCCTPFGIGLHKCAGMELTKMEMAIFIHHLVLHYEWDLVVSAESMWHLVSPHEFPMGLPIKVHSLR